MKISTRIMNMSKSEIGILFLFTAGLLFCLNYRHSDVIEGMSLRSSCPNMLIRKGKELHLVYSNKPEVPGVNPVKFDNLEEYAEFVNFQKANNKQTCPILYLQETETAQGGKGLRVLDDPIDPAIGLRSVGPPKLINPDPVYIPDARKGQSVYNQNMFTGMDPNEQNVGVKTPMDNIVDGGTQSANPMAKNWGGHVMTNNAVKSGRYDGRTRESTLNPFTESQFYSQKPHQRNNNRDNN